MTFDVAQALLAQPGSRRKKRYVLHLLSGKVALPQDVRAVTRAVASAMPEHTLIRLEDPDEALKVLLLKNVELIVVDDSFFGDDHLAVEYALEVKKRKKCPVFFTTRNENRLIEKYRDSMGLYEELDDFVTTPLDGVDLARKLRRASAVEGRAARRFPVDEAITVERIDDASIIEARLVDVSLVGFGVQVAKDILLTRLEQVRVRIPLPPVGLFHPQYGELLKLAGRVRRVSIDGSRVGCSLEHVTPMQSDCLTRLLEQFARRHRMAKIQAPKPKEAS